MNYETIPPGGNVLTPEHIATVQRVEKAVTRLARVKMVSAICSVAEKEPSAMPV